MGDNRIGTVHSIDIRVSVPLLFRRYYLVFIAGPERRDKIRRQRDQGSRRMAKQTNVVFMIFMSFLGLSSLLGMLYLLKSALGIDLLPDTSLGLWQQVTEQLGLMFR